MADDEAAPLLDAGEPAAAPAAGGVREPEQDADGNLKALTKEDALDDLEDTMTRSCTDLPCCMLFLVACLFLWSLHGVAFKEGDPRRLFYGKDHDGLVCGVDDAVKDFPYVYYPYMKQNEWPEDMLNVEGQGLVISLQLTELKGVCTKTCPDKGVEMKRDAGLCPGKDGDYCSWYGQNNSVMNVRDTYCVYQDPKSFQDHGAMCRNVKAEATGAITDLNDKNVKQLEELKQVVVQADASLTKTMDEAIEHMRMEGEIAKAEITVAVDKTSESCTEANTEPAWVSNLSDLIVIKEVLFTVPVLTMAVGFAYFMLLRYFAGFMIFGIIFFIIGGFGVGSFILFNLHETYMLEGLEDDASYCWYGSIFCGGLSLIVLLITLCSCTTLRMTAAMMKTVAIFLMQTPSVLMTVPMMLMFSAAWLLYMVMAGLFLVSTLKIHPTESLAGELTRYEMDKPLIYKCMYHLLMTLWINAIFSGVLIIGLAVSVRHWYYAKPDASGNKVTPFGIGFKSVFVAFRYHFGSAVFGGLLLAIIQMMRIMLEVVKQQAKKYQESNSTVQFIIKAVEWFLWCMQKVVEMINQAAYIIVGLKGTGFYTSAKRAVSLMMSHPQRFFVLHGVGVLLEYVGILVATAGAEVFYYNIIVYAELDKKLRSLFAPMIAIFLIAALTAKVFFSLFTASADAFFFCFIFDEEIAKVTGASDAKHCPPTLKAFLEDGSAKKEGDDDKGRTCGCC